MKIKGLIVDFLLETALEIYKDFIVYENGQKVIYVMMVMALYGML